jgi:hypothetical protein
MKPIPPRFEEMFYQIRKSQSRKEIDSWYYFSSEDFGNLYDFRKFIIAYRTTFTSAFSRSDSSSEKKGTTEMKDKKYVSFEGVSASDLRQCELVLHEFLSTSKKWRKFSSEVQVSYDPVSKSEYWIEGIRFKNFNKESFIILCLLAYYEKNLNLSVLLKLELLEKLERTKGLEDLALLVQFGPSVIKGNGRFNRRYFRSLFSKNSLREFEKSFSYKIQRPKTSKPKKTYSSQGIQRPRYSAGLFFNCSKRRNFKRASSQKFSVRERNISKKH